MEEGVDTEYVSARGVVTIDFTVSGEIAGGIEATKKLAQPWETEGKIGGKIGLGLKAEIKAEAAAKSRWIEIRFSAGAGAELRGAERESKTSDVSGEIKIAAEEFESGGAKQSRMGVAGSIKFNGMAIYYLVYWEVSVSRVDSESGSENSKTRRKKTKNDEKPKNLDNKEKYEGVVVLCEPWEWPEKSSKSSEPIGPSITALHKALV